tara:strand:- start:9 stop:497 length:489 start_codon:yes stop_codon:yes gene_type:complete
MVHRIQNRNPGYTDFSNMESTATSNFSSNNTSPLSHGANALKLENEVVSETISQQTAQEDINKVNNQYHEELLKNQEAEIIVENTSKDNEMSFAEEATMTSEQSENDEVANNDLSEFGVDSQAPDLFNNDSESSNSDELLSSENEDQEDDLEIPAFLRRQKN